MIEILPYFSLREEDALIFGELNVLLAKLHGLKFPVAKGFIVTPPHLHLQTVLKNYDFGHSELFEQSLNLVKKDLQKIPIPENLEKALLGKHKFLANDLEYDSVKSLWLGLIDFWLTQIKERLWIKGFDPRLTENLLPINITLIQALKAFGFAQIDLESSEVTVQIKKGKLDPKELFLLDEIISKVDKKLLMSYEYKWVLEGNELKINGIKPFNERETIPHPVIPAQAGIQLNKNYDKSTTKVFVDLSDHLNFEPDLDGVYLQTEKIFSLNNTKDSFENLVFKLVETALTFPSSPVLYKLADLRESSSMGKVRGSFRLIHQKSLFNPLIEALDFAIEKKQLKNIEIVIPFVRGVSELMEVKRLLAVNRLTRNSIKQRLEIAVPENILNIEDYLASGLDGVILNLDELIAHLNGFDPLEAELSHYKHEVRGLIQFLEPALKLIHKAGISVLAYGSLTLNPTILEFLVKTGISGIITEKYEAHSTRELLHQAEKKNVLSFG